MSLAGRHYFAALVWIALFGIAYVVIDAHLQPKVAFVESGGMTQGEEVTGQTVMLGGITVRDVRIVVLAGMPGEALLGQNVLRHLEVLQTAERMVLRRKPAG